MGERRFLNTVQNAVHIFGSTVAAPVLSSSSRTAAAPAVSANSGMSTPGAVCGVALVTSRIPRTPSKYRTPIGSGKLRHCREA